MIRVYIPSKEELVELYITKNNSKEDLCKIYNKSNSVISRWLSKYSIKKPRNLIVQNGKNNLLKKYGVSNPSQIKSVREKAQKTMIERYGVSNPSYSKELRNKAESTMLNRYGVKNASQSELFKNKKIDTCNKNFGVDFPMQSSKVMEKSKTSIINKYGVEHISKCPDIINKSRLTCKERYGVSVFSKSEKYSSIRRSTCLEKYGTEYSSQSRISKESLDILNSKDKLESFINSLHSKTFYNVGLELNISDITASKYIREHNLEYLMDSTISSQEQEIKDLFKELNLQSNRDLLDGKEIDLYSDEHKVGIEFNGNYWHSDKFRDKYYHRDKSILANKKGIFLFHIFEYEWSNPIIKNSIISRLNNIFNKNKDIVYARKCTIKSVSIEEATKFLNNNHTQGYAPSQIRLGLYYNNELVSLMEFITYGINKNYQYELSRFCSKAGTNVVGGASKLFKHFIKEYKPKSIVSYSDIAKTTGKIYETLGFKLDHISTPQYHWVNSSITYTRYQCQKKELKKRGWLIDGENKSESDVMRSRGFYKIYDCGKKVWVWK